MHSQVEARAHLLSGRRATAFHGITLASFFAASSAPTPLYRFYQATFSLSPLLMTVVFAVYAIALLKALLVAGSLSDHLGRKPVIFGALLLEAVAMALFLIADAPAWLVAARVVQGVATGIAGASIGAVLTDIDRVRGQFVNSIAPLAGMGIGAIGTSMLVQYGPYPLHLVYALFLATFLVQAAVLWFTPETAVKRSGALASLVPRIAVPAQVKKPLALVTPINIGTWALGGFYLSLVPSLVVATTGDPAPLTSGSLVALLTLAGAIAIALRRAKPSQANLGVGAMVLALGVAIVVVGVHLASIAVLVAGTAITGFGFGTCFLGAVGSIMPLAKPDERAELLSAFYIQSYLAFSIPAILAGYLINRLGYASTADIYAGVIIVLALVGLVGLRRTARAVEQTSG